jgi:hypothetical protein
MQTKYAILQSGFLAKDTTNLILPDPINSDNINTALRLGRAIKDNRSPHHFHADLDKLFDQHINDGKVLANFDYREKLLIGIIDAINSKNFFDWIYIQSQSEYYSELHYRLLKDTLDFIYTGHRSVAIESWLYLIKADKTNTAITKLPDPLRGYDDRNALIENILTDWTRQRHGFKDLLYFGKIVFGKTSARRVG